MDGQGEQLNLQMIDCCSICTSREMGEREQRPLRRRWTVEEDDDEEEEEEAEEETEESVSWPTDLKRKTDSK